MFAEQFEEQLERAKTGEMLVIEGELSIDDYNSSVKMIALNLHSVEEARSRFAKCLLLTMSVNDHAVIPALMSIFRAYRGDCVVQVRYSNSQATAVLNLGSEWRVSPSDQLIDALKDLFQHDGIELCYNIS